MSVLRSIAFDAVGYIACLLASLMLYVAIIFVLSFFCEFAEAGKGGAAKGIPWLNPELSLKEAFAYTILPFVSMYFYNSFFYLSIFIFNASAVAGILCLCISSNERLKGKRLLLLALFVCALVSCFLLSLLQGGTTQYRSMQSLSLFVPFIWMFVFELASWKRLWICLLGALILFQTKEINLICYEDWRASEENKFRVHDMVAVIRSKCGYEPTKPVVVMGRNNLREFPKNFSLSWLSSNFPFVRHMSHTTALIHSQGSIRVCSH